MINDLTGTLRTDFLMVLRRLTSHDRAELERRCDRIYAAPLDPGARAITYLRWDGEGRPLHCEIVLDPGKLLPRDFDVRLGVIAHEVAHVLSESKGLPIWHSEDLANFGARTIGFPHLRRIA